MSEHEHDDEDGYTGEATVVVGETELAVRVQLRGHFQPIDGYYHWYGRIAASPELSELLGGKKTKAELRTPEGTAPCELSDPDTWDRYRVMGTSTPPFHVPKSLEEIEAATA